MASLKYWLWLSELKHLSLTQKLILLEHFDQDPENIYHSEEAEYRLVESLTSQQARWLEQNKSLNRADAILGDCERLNLRILTIRDGGYPDRLRNIAAPPLVLYVQGRMPHFDEEVAVAMVGTRAPSAYGLEVGERLAFQMAGMGAIIVSGLAAGGDSAAHRGALRAGGFTAGVIGGGHDIIYPRESRALYEDLALRGVILSEYPPGTEHMGSHFPVRNRIISGLCQATVVIEAPESSGTLITANRALDQGRDVFAVPGLITDPHFAGSNRLIQHGAGLVTCGWDVLEQYADQFPHKIRKAGVKEPTRFGGEPPAEKPEKPRRAEPKELPVLDLSREQGLTDDQIRILKALGERSVCADELVEETQLPVRRVLSALTVLEIDGYVAQEAGKRFTLQVTLV